MSISTSSFLSGFNIGCNFGVIVIALIVAGKDRHDS